MDFRGGDCVSGLYLDLVVYVVGINGVMGRGVEYLISSVYGCVEYTNAKLFVLWMSILIRFYI